MWNLSHMMLSGTDFGCFLIHKFGEAVEKKKRKEWPQGGINFTEIFMIHIH
jgi:hypothetical protein